MRTLDRLLEAYGESHQNTTNKLVHWICVPAIMFSLLALLYAIPFFTTRQWFANWAFIALVLAWIYYARLSVAMLVGFVVIGMVMLALITSLFETLGGNAGRLAIAACVIFVVAWIGQFWGHKIEGKKPSFLQDVQYLLIGPAWLLHFIFRKLSIPY